MVGLTINLISETHHSCERREYAFMVLRKYTIIFLLRVCLNNTYLLKIKNLLQKIP